MRLPRVCTSNASNGLVRLQFQVLAKFLRENRRVDPSLLTYSTHKQVSRPAAGKGKGAAMGAALCCVRVVKRRHFIGRSADSVILPECFCSAPCEGQSRAMTGLSPATRARTLNAAQCSLARNAYTAVMALLPW